MKTISRLFVYFALIFTVSYCQQKPESQEPEDEHAHDPGMVELTLDQTKAIGLTTEKVSKRNISESVNVKGHISVPPQYRATINTKIPGVITSINKLVGDEVSKNEWLISAESVEFIELQKRYLILQSEIETTKADFERKETLQQENIGSKKEYLQSKSSYISSTADFNAVQSKLKLVGIDFSKLEQGIFQNEMYLRSPIEGKIAEINASVGQYIEENEELISVVDNEHVHVELQVFESDLPFISVGQQLDVVVPSVSSEKMEAEIFLISNVIGKDRTVDVHAHFENEDKINKDQIFVGQFVEVYINTSEKESIVVPTKAIYTREGQPNVMQALKMTNEDEVHFKEIAIQTHLSDGNYTSISFIDDFNIDEDELVVEGLFYIANALSESQGHVH